jgi:GNAT superfamily N-acetyltransferase
MEVTLRAAALEDMPACGRICFEAFQAVASEHRFARDWDTPEEATRRLAASLALPQTHAAVAEVDGRVVGSNFTHDRRPVAGIGPITIDPKLRSSGVGRLLMNEAMDWCRSEGFDSVRLVQAAYNNVSMALYASMGFDAVEPLTVFLGPPLGRATPGRAVRTATESDVEACDALHTAAHGFARTLDLRLGIEAGRATVVERDGRIAGYSAGVAFRGHAVGETNDDLCALIAAATELQPPGFLVPTRNGDLMRWCLGNGFRIVQPMTLMSMGWYQEPALPFMPTITF